MQDFNVEYKKILLYKLKDYRLAQIISASLIAVNAAPWILISPIFAIFGGILLFLVPMLVALSLIAQAILLILDRKYDTWYKLKLALSLLLVISLWGTIVGLIKYQELNSSMTEWLVYACSALGLHIIIWFVIALRPKSSTYQALLLDTNLSNESITKVRQYYMRNVFIVAAALIISWIALGIVGALLQIGPEQITTSISGGVIGTLIFPALALIIYFIVRRATIK